jgi:colanic acid/amylovoran biosynthesis glycosyltransferase
LQSKIVYVVSLFPCWSETFIVREINEMIALGVDVRIVSLKHPSERMVQSDAAALLNRVVYPASTGSTWRAVIGAFLRHPLTEFRDLLRIFNGMWRYPTSCLKTLATWWRTLGLLATVRDMAPEHIHAHWATYPSTSAWLLSRRLRLPFSFTAHAHDIFLEEHLLPEKMNSAAFTVAISKFNRAYLAERVRGARDARVEIVHCGVSPQIFPFAGAGRDAGRILAIGRLDHIKGFSHLVSACGLLYERGVAFECDIVGSGPLQDALSAQIEALGLQGKVHLLGARKQEEVRAFLHSAAMFVLPSVVTSRGDRDGIPVAIMEAMASGVPVVSTRVSGIPELVEDGVTGLLADPEDAVSLAACIERLIGDPELVERLALSARKHVEQEFDVAKEAAKLFDAIHNSHHD